MTYLSLVGFDPLMFQLKGSMHCCLVIFSADEHTQQKRVRKNSHFSEENSFLPLVEGRSLTKLNLTHPICAQLRESPNHCDLIAMN